MGHAAHVKIIMVVPRIKVEKYVLMMTEMNVVALKKYAKNDPSVWTTQLAHVGSQSHVLRYYLGILMNTHRQHVGYLEEAVQSDE